MSQKVSSPADSGTMRSAVGSSGKTLIGWDSIVHPKQELMGLRPLRILEDRSKDGVVSLSVPIAVVPTNIEPRGTIQRVQEPVVFVA